MSITVVVTRDYDDAPSCFEKYELGTRWRVNGGNLEIFVGPTLAALYPSGNWISVFVDDAMQLHKEGEKPDYSTMPTVDAGPARAGGTSAARALSDESYAPAASSAPVEQAAAEVYRSDGTPWTPPADDPDAEDVPLATSATYFPDDVVDHRSAMTPVAFRPRRYRTAPPPAKKAPTGPRMLPIRFRMRRFSQDAPPAPAETAAEKPRMMQVPMRTTIYRAARADAEDPARDDPAEDE